MATRREKERKKIRYSSAKDRAEKHSKGRESGALNIPEGKKLLTVKKAGVRRWDHIPYKTKNNPFCDPGEWHYERTYFVHRDVGPDDKTVTCLLQTFGEPCPICDHKAKLKRNPDVPWETIKAYEPKERQLFLVIDREDGDGTVQPVDLAWWNYGKALDKKTEAKERYHKFYHLDGGYTVEVTFEEKSMGKGRNPYYEASNIEMEPRDEPLDEELLEHGICLDDIIKKMSYKEIDKMFQQGAGGGGKKKVENEDDQEDDDEEEDSDDESGDELEIGTKVAFDYKGKHLTGEVVKIRRDKRLAEVEVKGRERPSVVDLDELEIITDDEEEEEEEERPKKKRKVIDEDEEEDEDERPRKKSRKDEEEDDEEEWNDEEWDEDEDEDEEEKPRKKKNR